MVLRFELRKHWALRDEEQFRFSGQDWLVTLLGLVDRNTGACVLLLLWRVRHLRNDLVHAKGTETIVGSALFFASCSESLHVSSKPGYQAGYQEGGYEPSESRRRFRTTSYGTTIGRRHHEAGCKLTPMLHFSSIQE